MSERYCVVCKVDSGWRMACGYGFEAIEGAKAWIVAHPPKNIGELKISTRPPADIGAGWTSLNPSDFVE